MQYSKWGAVFVVAFMLLFPFHTKRVDLGVGEVSLYRAAIYSVVKVDVFGYSRTKLYLIPSNFEANHNFNMLTQTANSLPQEWIK